MRKGGWKIIEIHGNVPIFDMWCAFRHHEIGVDLGDFCQNSSDKLFFLNSARCQILLFANKKKDLVRIELTFYRMFQLLSESIWSCIGIFLSIFAPRHFFGPSINELVTDGNTKICYRGIILALFQNTTANKLDSERYPRLTEVIPLYWKLKYYK